MTAKQAGEMARQVRQGEIYWPEDDISNGSEPGYTRPYVVIQSDFYNAPLRSVLACALTSNLRRADAPGTVLLDLGEVNLSKRNVVNVSQTVAVDKEALGERIGSVSQARVVQILQALEELTRPRTANEEPDVD